MQPTTQLIFEHPVSWYIQEMAKGRPIVSVLYGDGEFRVIRGAHTGSFYTHYRELVTPTMVEELSRPLRSPHPDYIFGTDPNLINYHLYQGGDKEAIIKIGREIEDSLKSLGAAGTVRWVDGVVWDTASRSGEFNELFHYLRKRRVVLVANQRLINSLTFLRACVIEAIPNKNAFKIIDDLERKLGHLRGDYVYLLCMGLGAIPLATRLHYHNPEGQFFDIGSAFDVFGGIGAERGWRNDLYSNRREYQRIIAKHLNGVR